MYALGIIQRNGGGGAGVGGLHAKLKGFTGAGNVGAFKAALEKSKASGGKSVRL